jgi:integrase
MRGKIKAKSKLYKLPWDGPPRIRINTNKSGKSFEVDLGRLHQGPGTKGRRKTYDSLGEAIKACRAIKREHQEQGRGAFRLTAAEKSDAFNALKLCRELGVPTLTNALERLTPFLAPPVGDISVCDLREEWLANYQIKVDQELRKKRAKEDLDKRTMKFARQFGHRLTKEVAPLELWAWLAGMADERKWATITLRHEVQAVSQLFTFARKKGYVGMNPLDAPEIAFEKEERLELPPKRPPRVFTLEETRRLLWTAHAQNKNRELLGYVTLLLFCGLRPVAEGSRIGWEDVDLDGRKVYVRPDKSKNRTSDRTIPLCDAAVEWLMIHRKKPLIPKSLRTLESRWQGTRKDAGIEDRKGTSVSRHSFASYRYAITESQSQLIDELGHCDRSMLSHYRSINPEISHAADSYFTMGPEIVLGDDGDKVIDLQRLAG